MATADVIVLRRRRPSAAADVMTFYMAGPIYVAAISHFFPGEGRRRQAGNPDRIWWRVIALHPSAASLSWSSIFALVGSFSYSDLINGRQTRRMPRVTRRLSLCF